MSTVLTSTFAGLCTAAILATVGCSGDDSGGDAEVDGTDQGQSLASEAPSDCGGARPTWIGGDIYGWPDRRALDAQIGVDHNDANGVKIDANGVACGAAGSTCCGGYSWCMNPNPTIDPEGSTDAALSRKWGRCVSAKVKEAFFEIYPKNAQGKTDFARYGAAAHQHQSIVSGGDNNVTLRLPLIHQVDPTNGNTGAVNGYITCNGKAVPAEDVTRVRAWSTETGTDCGIQGFSASATAVGVGASGAATYYLVDYLAGGQCGAADQTYQLYMDVICGGVKKTQSKRASVARGARPRVDWAF